MGIKESLFGVWNKFVESTTNGLYQLSLAPQQRFIRFLINNSIKQYLLNPIQKDEFDTKFNMGSGIISMKDVVLDKNVLNEKFAVGLPFKFDQVTIENIDFEIPLLNINTQPIKVKVKGVEVIIVANTTTNSKEINQFSTILLNSNSSDDISLLSSTIRQHLTTSDDHSSLESSINLDNLRPEDNDEVFDSMQSKIFEILSNGIVEIENLSIFIQTPTSTSSLELNILSAIFSYENTLPTQDEKPFGEVNSSHSSLKPKLEFNQLSMLIHQKDESVNLEFSKQYFFGSRLINDGDFNSLIISQSSDEELIVDIKFNSVVSGMFGQKEFGDLLDLLNSLSDSLGMPSEEQINSTQKQQKDVSIRVSIPKLDYFISLPILRDTISTKNNFKIQFIGDNTLIQYSKRYFPSSTDEKSITVTELSFDSIEVILLPNGDNHSKYRCLYLHSGDEDLYVSSSHIGQVKPKITIVQKPLGYVLDEIDESKYIDRPFLSYYSPLSLSDYSIEQANRLSTTIINCQLPDCLLSLFKSDYECLMNAFSFTSDQPQTFTMLFTLSTRVTIELKFDPYFFTNSNDPDRVKIFKLLTGDMNLIASFGYPSNLLKKDLYDSTFLYLTVDSLDTIATCISREQLFFSNRGDLDGIELMISSHGITIDNNFELRIAEICFIPSMRLITDFLEWIKLQKLENEVSVIDNTKRQEVSANTTPYHIELIDCTAKFFTRETQSQLMLLYEKLSILVSPEGKEDDLCLVFQPVQILHRKVSDNNYSFKEIQHFDTIGFSSKPLMIYLRNVTASEKGIKVEILSNDYQLEFDKNTYHSITTTFPYFLKKVFERIVISNEEISSSNDNIAEYFNQSQINIKNSPQLIDDYGESKMSPNQRNNNNIEDFDELEEGFEMIQSELDFKRTLEIVMLDTKVSCKLFDNSKKDHITIDCNFSEILLQNYETQSDTSYSSSIRVNISEIFIRDRISQSPYQDIFGPLSFFDDRKKNNQYLISFLLYSKKDNFDRDHYNIKLFIDPLFVQAFQSSVDFIIDFFLNNHNSVDNSNNEIVNSTNNESKVIFDEVEIFPLSVRIDYIPKPNHSGHSDENYSSFTSGEYIWMFSMIPLKQAMFTFPKVELFNIPQPKLIESVLGVYYPNILNTNVFQYLTGVTPVKILFNVGSGFTALIRQPIKQARGPDGVLVGVGKGVGMGITTLTVELLSASASVVKAGYSLLKPFTSNSNSTSLIRQPETDSISKGAQKAVSQVFGGFKNAAMGILYKPIVNYKSEGAKGFLSALLWGVPRVVVDPVVGMAEGFATFSTSIRNSLDSSRIINDRKKYKIISKEMQIK